MKNLLMCSLLVVVICLTGCVRLDIASDIKLLSRNQILTSRATVADESTVNMAMKGGEDFGGTIDIPVLSATTHTGSTPVIRLLSDLEVIAGNQIGASRSVNAFQSEVGYEMEGGEKININANVDLTPTL